MWICAILMKLPFSIRFPSSISARLLLFVLPLLCLPIGIVSYLTYRASVESVTRLSRNGQITQVKADAAKINNIYITCYADLNIISRLIVEDLRHYAGADSEIEKRETGEKIAKILQDFVSKSPYYIRIRVFDSAGQVIPAPRGGQDYPKPLKPFRAPSRFHGKDKNACLISKISYSEPDKAFIVQISRPISPIGDIHDTKIILYLDFSKVIELVDATRTGKLGFAFLVDQSGRTIAHPLFEPYQYDFSKYDDPLLREVIVDMVLGETLWRTYRQITEYAVAIAPLSSTGWSLALSMPMDEFNKEVIAVRRKVLEFVIVILAIVVLCASFLPHFVFRQLKDLVAAAKDIAGGGFGREIPVNSSDELGTLTRSFNRMAKKCLETRTELNRSEKLISLGRLSAGVAHEVRNPLNAMKGAIIYLQKHRSEDGLIREYTQLIFEEINRLDKFVTKFLYFAKKSSPNRVPTDLNELISSTLNFLKGEFKNKGIEISLHLEPSLPLVLIDPHQMEQVFLNLFVNSMHAMPDGGSLRVSSQLKDGPAKGSGPRAAIEIKDNGLGIPSEHYNYIYDLFFSTKEDGTGLGLPISLDIIKEHGGDMNLMSQEGEGTTVIIELPLEDYGPYMETEDEKEDSDR